MLYEELAIAEYWVVDVRKAQVLAFAISNLGSRRITQSQVLPGLAIAFIEEVLQRSRQINQSELGTWLIAQLQESNR